MTAPVFGLQFIQVDDQSQPVYGANMDVVGLVGPCSTANPQMFPLNTPVLRFSNDTTLAHDLGNDGYLLDAIEGLNTQLVDFQVAIQMVIVRTDYGTALDANQRLEQTIANIMGQSTAGTGVWALIKAPMTLYCTPRVIICPGYTGQLANSLDTLLVNLSGFGYIPGQEYQISFVQGNGETNGANLVLPMAHAVADHNGQINNTELFIDSWGAYMTVPPIATLPAADGPPIIAQPAGGQLIFNAVPGVGATINLNGSTVTFIAATGTPTGNQVKTAADLGTALANLLAMLNGSADAQISKLNYTLNGGTLTMVDKTAGASGNTYTLAGTVTGMSLSGTHLVGGVDAASPINATLTVTIALGANPVCAALGPVCDTLIGHAIVESAGTSTIQDFNWRDTLNHQRLIGLSGGVKVIDPLSGNVIVRPLAPRVAGLLIGRDFATGYPFHSCANQPIQGIVGPARTISFSITDGSTEGQVLLAGNIGIVVRGLVGVETAISSGGFIFVGTDNLGDDQLWQFYNVKRGRDYIHLSLMPALRTYLGRSNIDRQTVANVLLTIKGFLATLKARQLIIDYAVNFQGSLNSASEIRLGHLTVGFQAEEPPVLRRITTMSARYAPAIDMMVQQLQQQLNLTS